MGSVTDLVLNKTLSVVKLSIANESHNISNIVSDVQIWQTFMMVGIGEINTQGWIWKEATRIMNIFFVLAFLENF